MAASVICFVFLAISTAFLFLTAPAVVSSRSNASSNENCVLNRTGHGEANAREVRARLFAEIKADNIRAFLRFVITWMSVRLIDQSID